MHARLRLIVFVVVGLFLNSPTAMSQSDACVGLLRHGIYDTFRSSSASGSSSQAQQQFCSSYQQYKRDVQNGSVQVSYAPFSGGASYSRDQMESLGSAMCEASFSSAEANASLTTFSSTIDQAAVTAYRECVSRTAEGLQSSTEYDEDTGTGFSLSVSYIPPPGTMANVIFGGVTESSSHGLTCQGSLSQLRSNQTFAAGHVYQLDCRRTIEASPISFQNREVWALPYTVTVGTSAGSIVRTLLALPAAPPPTPQIVPVGTIIPFSGTMQQAVAQQQFGWWVADGRIVNDSEAIAFKGLPTPDLRNRFIFGSAAAGQTGGDLKATVPAQTINSHTTGGFGSPSIHGDPFTHMQGAHSWTTDGSIYSAGDFAATAISLPPPPYYSVIYLVKVK